MAGESARVLVCPLDWGLGHAARCIPVIDALLTKGANVLLAGNGDSIRLLRSHYPLLEHVELPGMSIRYGKKGMTAGPMLIQAPAFIYNFSREHKATEQIVSNKGINCIISDNRYGCWSARCKSVIISHQLQIKVPRYFQFAEKYIYSLIEKLISRFDECWVPDDDAHTLSGELSVNHLAGVKYTGILSRFYRSSEDCNTEPFDVVAVLSGPEPQRTFLEELILLQLKNAQMNCLVVRGVISKSNVVRDKNITLADQMGTAELHYFLRNAKYIICRSGYSSLMDLAALGRSAIIIPTPGQTEQEYLGMYHHDKNHVCMDQQNIDLSMAFQSVNRLTPIHMKVTVEQEISRLMAAI